MRLSIAIYRQDGNDARSWLHVFSRHANFDDLTTVDGIDEVAKILRDMASRLDTEHRAAKEAAHE